jgi:signal transduction histidine kinase
VIISNRLLPRVLLQVLPVTVVVLLAIGYFAHVTVRQSALDEHQKGLEQIAAQSATSLAVRLQNVVDTAHTLAVNELVINSLIDLSDRERYIPTLFQSLRLPGSNRARVTLVDYRGRRIASNMPGPGYSTAEWISGVMDGHELVQTGVGGMIVAIPVLYANLAEGMVVIEFDARGFSEFVALPIQADGYAIRAVDGGAIFASIGDLLRSDKGDRGNAEWMTVATTMAGFPGLSLVTGDRMANVLVPIERQKTFLLAAILLSIAAVGAGIFVTAIKVVNPVRKFIGGVEKVSGSDGLGYRMEPFGTEEFQHLTGSFNTMLGDIESTTTSLDYTDAVLNSMSEFLLVASADGQVQSGNRAMARALGCRVRDLPGRNVSSLVSVGWQELAASMDKDRQSIECELITGTGAGIPVLVSASPMRPKGDDPDQSHGADLETLILVLKDITEQLYDKAQLDKHVNDLERSNADLEQFAYVASHDLKAPLRAIDNLAGWIEEDVAEHMSDDSREHMTLLRGRIGRLESLLEGLLRYARTGRDETEKSWVDTGSLVSEAVELLGEPEIVSVDIPGDLPRIHTSAAALQQVFRNLIGNAVKHRDRDDVCVEIGYRDLEDVWEFSVTDDGPGIPEQYHDRIFQMFQTLKRRDEVEGSGLGLAMVRKLVRAHGGEIDVGSSEGERGAVFRFTWAKPDANAEQTIQMEGKHAA